MYNKRREDLAWAAGFFDGEGTTNLYNAKTGSVSIRLSLPQKDPQLLYRFRDIVGFGNIIYAPTSTFPDGTKRERYVWYVSSFAVVQHIIAMLWSWLGIPKREQATTALCGAIGKKWLWQKCSALGHRIKVFVDNEHSNGRHVCLDCFNAKQRLYYQKRKAL